MSTTTPIANSKPATEAHRVPASISGGCLCGAVHYKIAFGDAFTWPPVSSTCQCTMCRKWTSSLVAQFIVVSPAQLECPFSSFTTYREYESSPGRFRGFCGQCGTSLIWRSADKTRAFDLFLGTVDEEWLVGRKGEHGRGDVGKVLATPNGTQFWMENAIEGVTDLLTGGAKYPEEGPDGLNLT